MSVMFHKILYCNFYFIPIYNEILLHLNNCVIRFDRMMDDFREGISKWYEKYTSLANPFLFFDMQIGIPHCIHFPFVFPVYYAGVTWTSCNLKSSVIQLFFITLCVPTLKKQQSLHHRSFEGNSPVTGEFPAVTRKRLPFDAAMHYVDADDLALSGARPFVGTIKTTRVTCFLHRLFSYRRFWIIFIG